MTQLIDTGSATRSEASPAFVVFPGDPGWVAAGRDALWLALSDRRLDDALRASQRSGKPAYQCVEEHHRRKLAA